MNSNFSGEWYKLAYDMHYKRKEYENAYGLYSLIRSCFSTSKEANWAQSQMNNLLNEKKVMGNNDLSVLQYSDISEMFTVAINNIKMSLASLPDAQIIECGIPTFSRSGNDFYICEIGNPDFLIKNFEKMPVENQILFAQKMLYNNILSEKNILRIPLENIAYFQQKGDISYSTSISGGGARSKDVNLAGAVAGGLLFGNTGALIGSRIGTGIEVDEIRSTVHEHDNRYVVLKVIVDGKPQEAQYDYECYDAFVKLIPEKEYDYVAVERDRMPSDQTPIIESKTDSQIPVQALKDLKMLLDEGIITQEEFGAKKKQLLDI